MTIGASDEDSSALLSLSSGFLGGELLNCIAIVYTSFETRLEGVLY